MPDVTQPAAASITYTDDWTSRLANAYPASTVTIASATASATGGAVVTGVTNTTTSISFHLATSGVTAPTDITVTLTATLSNGDIDPRTIAVGVSS